MIEVRERKRPEKPKPSRLDRFGESLDNLIFAIAPTIGERRKVSRLRRRLVDAQARRIDSLGYPTQHPNVSRDSRYLNNRDSIDSQLEMSLTDMQFRSREMYQANPHAHGAIEGRVAHEVGVGLACRPRIREGQGITKEAAEACNAKLKDVCERWSDHGADRRRQQSLSSVQRLVCRTYATYGEAFVLFSSAPYTGPIGLCVEVINPMRVETPPNMLNDPNVRMGVKYHPTTDQPVGYYVRETDRGRSRFGAKYTFVPRFDDAGQEQMRHVFEPLLPGQSRGIPWICAAMAFLKDLDDFHEAELIAKQIEACFGLIFKGGKSSPVPADIADGNAAEVDSDGSRLEELYPGMVHYASDDEEVTTVDPQRPGASFAPFVEASLRTVAAALNYPYELLAKNFFRTTYSSGRLAMLDGRLGFKMRGQVLVDQFMKPMWRRLVNDAFFHGEMEGLATRVSYLANRYMYERHSWGGQAFGAVDPEKESKAHKIALESDQETLAEVFAERNSDWLDALEQRDVEKRKTIELEVARQKYRKELMEDAGLELEAPAEEEEPEEVPA